MIKYVEIMNHGAIKITLFTAALCVTLLSYSALIYAQEYRFLQGAISFERTGYLVVNEDQRVNLLEETVIKNNRDDVIPLSVLKVGRWVYVEGPLNLDGTMDAEVIYLLPGRIPKKERFKYPFMKLPF